jgi:hypothetical protein
MLKKGPKQLDKSWKQTASDLTHGKCREQVIRKTERLGKAYVTVGEPCSTLVDPVCGTLIHLETTTCIQVPIVKSTSIRDESGRAIGLWHMSMLPMPWGNLKRMTI